MDCAEFVEVEYTEGEEGEGGVKVALAFLFLTPPGGGGGGKRGKGRDFFDLFSSLGKGRRRERRVCFSCLNLTGRRRGRGEKEGGRGGKRKAR